jgi:hypothetical protein
VQGPDNPRETLRSWQATIDFRVLATWRWQSELRNTLRMKGNLTIYVW